MYAKHGNIVDADASIEVIQGHALWDHWKADEGLRITV